MCLYQAAEIVALPHRIRLLVQLQHLRHCCARFDLLEVFLDLGVPIKEGAQVLCKEQEWGCVANRMAVSMSSQPTVHVDRASARHHHRMQCQQQLHSRVQSSGGRPGVPVPTSASVYSSPATWRLCCKYDSQYCSSCFSSSISSWKRCFPAGHDRDIVQVAAPYGHPTTVLFAAHADSMSWTCILPLTLLGIDLIPRLQ